MKQRECNKLWSKYVLDCDIPIFLLYQEFILQSHCYDDGSMCRPVNPTQQGYGLVGRTDGGMISDRGYWEEWEEAT